MTKFEVTTFRGTQPPYKVFNCRFLSRIDAVLFCEEEARKPDVRYVSLSEWHAANDGKTVWTWKQFSRPEETG